MGKTELVRGSGSDFFECVFFRVLRCLPENIKHKLIEEKKKGEMKYTDSILINLDIPILS